MYIGLNIMFSQEFKEVLPGIVLLSTVFVPILCLHRVHVSNIDVSGMFVSKVGMRGKIGLGMGWG